jgi:hypothetical protein
MTGSIPRLLGYASVGAGVAAAGYVGLVTGACPLDIGIGRRVRPLGPELVEVAAPREVVFDVIAEPYLGRAPRALADKLRVLEAGSDMVLAAHSPRSGGGWAWSPRRWGEHAAGLPRGDRGRPVAGRTALVCAGRPPLGADGRGLAGRGQGRSRTAGIERPGTPALQLRAAAPTQRLTAAADRTRRNLGDLAIGCRFRPGSFVGQVSAPPEAEEGHMAKYLVLIYGQESAAAPTLDQWDQMMQAHGQFAQAVDQQGGKILGGEALQPTATATAVRNDGQAVTDGPFVETKEALGGFYLIEAADLDQALAFAKRCPAPGGGVELRPIMDTSGAPPSA